MKHLAAAVPLGLVLGPGSAAALTDTWREQSDKVIEARGLTGVEVENRRGVVAFHRSADGKIHVTALKITRATDREHSLAYARETQVLTAVEDGRLAVRVRYSRRQSIHLSFWDVFSGFELPSVEVRLSIDVPDGLAVDVSTKSGDLTTEDLNAPQALVTSSGDITVHSAHGPIRPVSSSGNISAVDVGRARLQSVSGDLEVEDAHGPLTAGTTSGGISVTGAEDSLSLTTVSGDIRVTSAPRGLVARTTSGDVVAQAARGVTRLETSSGDVRIELEAPLSQADITTVSGNIGVHLASTLACRLEMRTTNGTLDTSVPLQLKTVSRHLVTGTIRSGTAPVTLRSSSGDIEIKTGAD